MHCVFDAKFAEKRMKEDKGKLKCIQEIKSNIS